LRWGWRLCMHSVDNSHSTGSMLTLPPT
jgi:hypothetical protein